ncbi:DUF2971 domain-containing protein [Candidatus Spongiihabitans sp.]|uniref:DUF2971 domain-containing protein n=1 Tax=Candidatus Spongiihabitans sp. TaxID=3101308 RepID=UPI003C7A7088
MRVYKFLNKKYGLEALRDKRLKISNIMDLNDPFEFLGVELSNKHDRRSFEGLKCHLSKKYGLLCFSESRKNPVQWAHYAEEYKGLCLGFDIPETNKNLLKVRYVENRFRSPKNKEDANNFMDKLLTRKFLHWKYEQEYRCFEPLRPKTNGFIINIFLSYLILNR